VVRRDESLADEFVGSQHIGIDRRRVSWGDHQLARGEPQRLGEQPDFRLQHLAAERQTCVASML